VPAGHEQIDASQSLVDPILASSGQRRLPGSALVCTDADTGFYRASSKPVTPGFGAVREAGRAAPPPCPRPAPANGRVPPRQPTAGPQRAPAPPWAPSRVLHAGGSPGD